jgi:hypothetical protein
MTETIEEDGTFVKGAWYTNNSAQTSLGKYLPDIDPNVNVTQSNDYNVNATTASTYTENVKKTFISANKIIDFYNNNVQIVREYPRDEIEEHYQNQLKNFEKKGRIQLYDGEPIPEDLMLEVDGSGRVIPKSQSTLDKFINMFKFW